MSLSRCTPRSGHWSTWAEQLRLTEPSVSQLGDGGDAVATHTTWIPSFRRSAADDWNSSTVPRLQHNLQDHDTVMRNFQVGTSRRAACGQRTGARWSRTALPDVHTSAVYSMNSIGPSTLPAARRTGWSSSRNDHQHVLLALAQIRCTTQVPSRSARMTSADDDVGYSSSTVSSAAEWSSRANVFNCTKHSCRSLRALLKTCKKWGRRWNFLLKALEGVLHQW